MSQRAVAGASCRRSPGVIVNIGNAKLGHLCLGVSARMLEVLREFPFGLFVSRLR